MYELINPTDGDDERNVDLAGFALHLLLAVDDAALVGAVVDGELVQAVLVVVPHHAAVVDAAVAAVGVAAVLGHAAAGGAVRTRTLQY